MSVIIRNCDTPIVFCSLKSFVISALARTFHLPVFHAHLVRRSCVLLVGNLLEMNGFHIRCLPRFSSTANPAMPRCPEALQAGIETFSDITNISAV